MINPLGSGPAQRALAVSQVGSTAAVSASASGPRPRSPDKVLSGLISSQPRSHPSSPKLTPAPRGDQLSGMMTLPNEILGKIGDTMLDQLAPAVEDVKMLSFTNTRLYHALGAQRKAGRAFHRHPSEARTAQGFITLMDELARLPVTPRPAERADCWTVFNVTRAVEGDFGFIDRQPVSHRSMAMMMLSKRFVICTENSATTETERTQMLATMSAALKRLPAEQRWNVVMSMISLVEDFDPSLAHLNKPGRYLEWCLDHLKSVPQSQQGALISRLSKAMPKVDNAIGDLVKPRLQEHALKVFTDLQAPAGAVATPGALWNMSDIIGALPDAPAESSVRILEGCLENVASLPLSQQGEPIFRLAETVRAARDEVRTAFEPELEERAAEAFVSLAEECDPDENVPRDALLSMCHMLSALHPVLRVEAADFCLDSVKDLAASKDVLLVALARLGSHAMPTEDELNFFVSRCEVTAARAEYRGSIDPTFPEALLKWHIHLYGPEATPSLELLLLIAARAEFKGLLREETSLKKLLSHAGESLSLVRQVQKLLADQSDAFIARALIPLLKATINGYQALLDSEGRRGLENDWRERRQAWPLIQLDDLHAGNMGLLRSLPISVTGKGTGAPPTRGQKEVNDLLRELDLVERRFVLAHEPDMARDLHAEKVRLLNDAI